MQEYFQNRPQDLLILDIDAEVMWEPLCEFLNQLVPNQPFPHVNRRDIADIMRRKKVV